MPALMLNKFWHQYNSNLPENTAFHKILDELMEGIDPGDKPEILRRLENAYRQFEDLNATDPAPDAWVVTKAWLQSKGIVVP